MTQEQDIKIRKIREILPFLWNSYVHMFEVRETTARNSISFLLVVATFLPILCITLYTILKSPLLLFPVLFQVLALLVLLKSFFIKGNVPWLELGSTLSELDNDSFDVDLFAALKAFEKGTWDRMKALRTIIKRALFLLIISILLVALACLFRLFGGGILLYVVTVLLLIVFSLLFFFYKDVPSLEFSGKKEEYRKDIEKWLENHKTEDTRK